MLRKFNLFIILFILIFVSTGCWDSLDINKRSIISAVGIGKTGEDIKFYVEIAGLYKSESKEESQKSDVFLVSSSGKTFNEASNYLHQQLSFPGFLGATRVVVFDKDYATECGIEPYLNRINKVYDYRKTLLITLCDDSKKLLSIDPKNQISAGFKIESIIRQLHNGGYIPYTTVSDLIANIAFGDIGFVAPYLCVKENKTAILGMGIFNNKSKLIDIISFKKSRSLLYLLSDKAEINMDIIHKEKKDNEENIMQFKVILKKCKVNTEYANEKVYINIHLKFEADLLYQYYNLQIHSEDYKLYEKKMEDKIKNDFTDLIEISQNKYKCDIFNFAKYFKAQNINQYRELDWSNEYPNSKINVQVDVKYLENNNIDYEIDYYKNNK